MHDTRQRERKSENMRERSEKQRQKERNGETENFFSIAFYPIKLPFFVTNFRSN